MKQPGLFVSVEGIDGSGKSTLVAAIGETFKREGLLVCTTREPGGTEVGKAIRAILLDTWCFPPVPMAELLLYLADRAQQVDTVLKPALACNDLVVTDRFHDSTIAYQGHGRQVAAPSNIAAWDRVLGSQGLRPDLTVLLDCPAFAGQSRLRGRGGRADRLERSGVEYFARVRQGFLNQAAFEPSRFVVLDAMRSASCVQDAAVAAIREKLAARAGLQP